LLKIARMGHPHLNFKTIEQLAHNA